MDGNVIQFLFGSECLCCGLRNHRASDLICEGCKNALVQSASTLRRPAEDVLCLFTMGELTRKLIHALKYRGVKKVAPFLVNNSCLAKVGRDMEGEFPKPWFFVPVPLHRARMRERGYNQAEEIAKAMAKITGGEVRYWLRRKTFRVSQTKLSKGERELNVVGAFVANIPLKIPRQGTVFVVDDVFTTGATTGACRSALGKNLPLEVKVCTLLYDEPANARMDMVADRSIPWDGDFWSAKK